MGRFHRLTAILGNKKPSLPIFDDLSVGPRISLEITEGWWEDDFDSVEFCSTKVSIDSAGFSLLFIANTITSNLAVCAREVVTVIVVWTKFSYRQRYSSVLLFKFALHYSVILSSLWVHFGLQCFEWRAMTTCQGLTMLVLSRHKSCLKGYGRYGTLKVKITMQFLQSYFVTISLRLKRLAKTCTQCMRFRFI